MENRLSKNRIEVMTKDDYLARKIALALSGTMVTERIRDLSEHIPGTPLLFDIDTEDIDESLPDAVTMSRNRDSDLRLPLRISELCRTFDGKTRDIPLSLRENEKCVTLRGERIRLTDVEHQLLAALMKRRGGYASREELLYEVWHGERDSGVVNVYIHYLREKLERHGEKIIVSSRKYGYGIDKKFIGGEGEC